MKAIEIHDFFKMPGVLVDLRRAVGAFIRRHKWAETDDLIHQAVVEMLEKPDELRAASGAEAREWLRTNTQRRHIDDIRRRRRRGEVPLAGVPEPEAPCRDDACDDRLDVLHARIERLPAADQEFLRLKHSEDLSVEEIAVRFEMTPAAVERRLGRIHQRLREAFKPPSGN